MIYAGDEVCRSQKGNNNAYAQDNEISWFDWNIDDRKKAFLEFTRRLIELRRSHPNFHRRKFYQDRQISPSKTGRQHVDGHDIKDISWYRPDGHEMTEDEWNAGWVRCLGMYLSGKTLDDVDRYGEPVRDDSFLLCLNPHHEHIRFFLPVDVTTCSWELLVDTRDATTTKSRIFQCGEFYDMLEHSAVLFREAEPKNPRL
jgi:glycogen operon protein